MAMDLASAPPSVLCTMPETWLIRPADTIQGTGQGPIKLAGAWVWRDETTGLCGSHLTYPS